MSHRLLAVLVIMLLAPSARAQEMACGVGHLATIEPDGSVSRGSKDRVRRAAASGVPLRVGWGLDANADGIADVSHWVDAGFVTEFEGEVFAQIEDIQRQSPMRGQARVRMPAGRQRWSGLVGTSGMLESHFDDGSEPTSLRVRSTWCVDPRVPDDLRRQAVADVDRAPEKFRVRLQTIKGDIVIDVTRAWAPIGVDRFYELVRSGYYNDVAFSRVIAGRWAQFGINGDPRVANEWRTRTIPDDPFQQSNVRGTVAFAFAVPNGRTTQVFVNLVDNRATHDKEPFVPFGRIDEAGMKVVDSLYSGYGEEAGSGIRSGKQGPIFEGGNTYLRKAFPKLDYIIRATIEP